MTGRNPRPEHARLNGATVGIDDPFPNGADWPGDVEHLTADQVANCNCQCAVTVRGGAVESGGVHGAYSRANDPAGELRQAHANMYYAEVRRRGEDSEVEAVARGSGIDRETVRIAYRHLFVEKHHLAKGFTRFDPDYYEAESWQRLRDGRNIQPHDLVLVRHEAYEASLMREGMGYDEAHARTNEVYNYQPALDAWIEGNEP